MKVICPKCSQVRDVTGMAPDSVVQCECGQAFRVPHQAPPSAPPPIEPGSGKDPEASYYSPQAAYTEPVQRPVYSGPAASVPLPTPGQAIASIILGFVAFWCCGPFSSIPGLILGYKARNMIDENPGAYGGRGVAVAGIVINWIAIGFFIVGMIFIGIGFLLEGLGGM